MNVPASASFTCNVCGATCERVAGPPGREVASCQACISTVRLRALVALLSQEMFGVPLSLPDFPVLKGVRAIGMSDPPNLATGLVEKFDYTNTFYHQEPLLDITKPREEDLGRYDFIISSEVMEHVPPPVESAFANLCRMLKPNGILLLTVPYRIDGPMEEHFPELYEYALASPGGRTVLVNRRRDGTVETFENLCFHGGDGSTLELRVYNEESLKQIILGAGFSEVRVASENYTDFGVEHAETWSLPIVARKGSFQPPTGDVALAYGTLRRKATALEREFAALKSDYERHIEFHKASHAKMEEELAARTEWGQKMDREFEERTQWALSLKQEKEDALTEFRRVEAEIAEAWRKVETLERSLAESRAAREQLEARKWVRVGRKLGAVK